MADTFLSEGKAYVRDLNGVVYRVPAGDEDHLFRSGNYAPVTESEVAQAAHNQAAESTSGVAAFGKAAARGAIDVASTLLTPRLHIAAAQALGLPVPKLVTEASQNLSGTKTLENAAYLAGEAGGTSGEAAARQFGAQSRLEMEGHPWATAAGQLLGTAAVAAPLAPLAGAALGGVGAATFEGALLGPNFASESAYLGNEELTSEKLLAYTGISAAAMGGLSLLGRGASALLGKTLGRGEEAGAVAAEKSVVGATEAEAAQTTSGKLESLANRRAFKFLGPTAGDEVKLGRTPAQRAAREEAIGKAVSGYKLETGESVFTANRDLMAERVSQARDELSGKLDKLRSEVSDELDRKPSLKPDVTVLKRDLQDQVLSPLQNAATTAEQRLARPVEDLMGDLNRLGPEPSLNQLTELRKSIDRIAFPKPKGGLAIAPESQQNMVAFRGVLEDYIEAATDTAVSQFRPGDVGKYQELKAMYSGMSQAQSILSRTTARTGDISMGSYMAGGAIGMAHGGPIGAVAAAVAKESWKRYGDYAVSVAARKAAAAFDSKVDRAISSTFSAGERTAPKLVSAVPTNRHPTVGHAMAAFLGKYKNKDDAYQARVKGLINMSMNNGEGVRTVVNKSMSGLGEVAPRTAGLVSAKAVGAAQFLLSKTPTPMLNTGSLTPNASRQPVSSLDASKFARYWATVENPLSALEDLSRGMLSIEQVETLQNVYPQIYDQIRKKTAVQIQKMDTEGKEVPLWLRLQMNVLLDLKGAGEAAFSPQFAMDYAGMAQAKEDKMGAQPTLPRRPIHIADRLVSGIDELNKKEH